MNRKIFSLILTLLLCLTFAAPALASEAAARVEWQYRDHAFGAHPTDLQLLDNGNILMVLNGFNTPGVREVTRDGEVVWRYDGVQAASARRLPNGNTLIAVSGAPGHPRDPRVIEVTPASTATPSRIITRYEPADRSRTITAAVPLQGGEILVTLPDRALVVNERGEARTLLSGGKLTLNPAPSEDTASRTTAGSSLQLWHLVTGRQTPGGNILLVDKGIRGRINGQVLELTPQGRLVRHFNAAEHELIRPVDALRLPDGSTLVLDLGAYHLYRYDPAGKLVERLSYRPVISELPVLNQWRGWLQPDNYFLLSLLYTNNQSLVVEINDKLPVLLLGGETLLPKGKSFMADGRLLVPLRPVLEALGGTLYQEGTTGAWVLLYRNRHVTLQTGSTAYTVNGGPRTLPLAPRLVEGSLYIPVTLLRDAFGLTVNWDGTIRTADVLL